MAKKLLRWSIRSQADRLKITEYYAQEASPFVADEAFSAIKQAAQAITTNPMAYREGVRANTHEYVMRRFPYTLIFRISGETVTIVRVMHQAAKYFN
jgi:plasmid stabilization system protein ParE